MYNVIHSLHYIKHSDRYFEALSQAERLDEC